MKTLVAQKKRLEKVVSDKKKAIDKVEKVRARLGVWGEDWGWD